MKLLSVLLVWAACLLPYLNSPRQQLLMSCKPLMKAWVKPGIWLLFSGCLVLAVYCLSFSVSVLVASFIVLTMVMCMWITLILMSSHQSGRVAWVCSLVPGMYLLISLVDVGHVS